MSILSAIFSLRSFSTLAFLATAGFLAYEIYQIWKAKKQAQAPEMPQFGEFTPLDLSDMNIPPPSAETTPKQAKIPKNTVILVAVLGFMSFLFALGALLGGSKSSTEQPTPTPIAVVSPTSAPAVTPAANVVKMYSQDWVEITKPHEGETVYIGVVNVNGTASDKARIRVNTTDWSTADETTNYNQEVGVYYRSITIPEEITTLRIEGQLHSTKDGWPN